MAPQDLVALFLGLGLPGLFGIAFAEKFVPIVPSYVMLMLLGMTVPDPTALLLALLATAAGSLCASLVWYGIGRGLGERRVATAVARFGKYVFFSPRTYAGLATAYRRNHFWVTLIGQTVPVARIYLALPAGVLGLRPAPFARAAAIGIAVWNAPFLALGYALRETGHTPVDVGFWVSLALVATEVAVVVGIRLLTRGRRTGPSPDDGPSAGPAPHPPAAFGRLSLGRIGSLEVRLATTRSEVRQAQRLRYQVFYEEMSAGSGGLSALFRRDTDAYDRVCDHLLVVDHGAAESRGPFGGTGPKVVGTYRLLRGEVAVQHTGFYAEGEYDLGRLLSTQGHRRLLELGRCCVLKPYRGKRGVELLWQGIYAYMLHHRIDALIGCASLEGTDPDRLALPLAFLHHHARAPEAWRANALSARAVAMDRLPREAVDARAALRALPPLIKGYLRLGATFGDGAVIDHQFGTTDVFVTLPLEAIGPRYRGYFAPAA